MSAVVVAIAAPLDPDLVPVIEAVDDRVEVRYQPDLLPPRCAGDQAGAVDVRRTAEQEERWRRMLADAEIAYGVPGDSARGLTALLGAAPVLRWVQATSEAVADRIREAGLTGAQGRQVMVTSARGIHVIPLAEFAIFGVLAAARGLPRLISDAGDQRWSPFPAAELAGQTLLLIGLGPVAAETARLATAFGMEVLAINRTGRADLPNVEMVRPARFLADLLPAAHAVVISLPLTAQTTGLIGAPEIGRMRRDAVVVHIGGRGVVDQGALIDGLRRGQPAAAVLDAFTTEPLPPGSPLWTMPNVLISPHSAARSTRENRRMVELFARNLERYLRGEVLVNRV